MMARLEIKNTAKKFKKKTALYPFSLTAREGQCIALCGGNGAGKSTLLHIIAGISSPSEGTVLVNNIDLLKNRKGYVTQIGYMPDEFFAQEAMTVLEFLNFYANLRRVPSKRVMEIIHLLGLVEQKNDIIKHLSKGMRQRLLFGQALIGNPCVLILDEPTNGLDPYWIDVFIKLLLDLKKMGTTIIFSTHMMDVAAETADQVLFMENGKTAALLTNDYQNTKEFMDKLLHLYRKKGDRIDKDG
jgi:ABC-2 type transport system ATP-binding protein